MLKLWWWFYVCSSGGAEVADTGHEEEIQERSNKAAFAQELFMSALFSE